MKETIDKLDSFEIKTFAVQKAFLKMCSKTAHRNYEVENQN